MINYLVSYSSKGFYERHKQLNASAKKYGIKNVISYHDTDLKRTKFYKENITILSKMKGGGYWLWKPYYILQALEKIEIGNNLFYVDAASIFISSPKVLFDICDNNSSGIVAFDTRPISNKQFCRRDTFINMNCDSSEFWDSPQTIATMILIKKTLFTVKLVKEWVSYCRNPYNIVNNNNDSEYLTSNSELDGFIDHRSDQSILSLILKKYNIETYRNPTKFGNFLKLPEYRVVGEFVGFPYCLNNSINDYSTMPMKNSPYGVIFEINLKDEPSLAFKIRLVAIKCRMKIKAIITQMFAS